MRKTELAAQVQLFTQRRPIFESFASRLEDLLKTILDGNSIPYHIVESRAKSVDSFEEKINRPGKKYSNPLEEMPDLCGCRIITYYKDNCVDVANLLRSEFDVLEEELSHQATSLEADRFGYISAHYIVRLPRTRSNLVEWRPFKEMQAEVQIRTVVQHAWSAVSHAVQYKEETKIPSELQRRLYRIAGLFELADDEFVGIRDQKARLQREAAEALASGLRDLPLTSETIAEMLERWPQAENVMQAAMEGGFLLREDDENPTMVADIYDLTKRSGITSTSGLGPILESPDFDFLRQLGQSKDEGEIWTASKFFLAYLCVIAACREHVSRDYLTSRDWHGDYINRIMSLISHESASSETAETQLEPPRTHPSEETET